MQEQLESEARDGAGCWQGIFTRNGEFHHMKSAEMTFGPREIGTLNGRNITLTNRTRTDQPQRKFSQQTGGYFTKENRDTHNKHSVPNYGIEGMI
jgi:hypothetical protein